MNTVKTRLLSVLLCVSMLITAVPFCVYAEDEIPEGSYVENEIIISCENEIEDISDGQSDSDGAVGIDFGKAGIVSIEKLETYSDDIVYVAEISGEVGKTCAQLNKNKRIIAEPNYLFEDSSFQLAPELSMTGDVYETFMKRYLNDILHIPDAWQANEVSGEGVTIAVIDSGFYVEATDFPKNLWKNSLGTVGWNIHDNNDDISPIFKSTGEKFEKSGMWATQHGTNVAGAIGMQANGIAGVGAAYGAELMLVKAASYVDDESIGIEAEDVIEAVDFARQNGADIINFSLSTTSNLYAMRMAVNRAYDDGIAFISSVANSGKATSAAKSYPAAYDNVIGVMAINTENPSQLMDFSNYDSSENNEYYDIAAPGSYIVGCDVIPGSLTMFSGSSQACAFVSSCAALYYEKYPNATVSDLYSAIRNFSSETVSSYPREGESAYTFKTMNALKLLAYCNHDTYISSVVTEPTCTEDGLMQYSCRVCGHTYTEPIPACHTWSKWEVTAYPGDGHDGACERHCLNCDAEETDGFTSKIKGCDVDGSTISGIEAGMSVSEFKSKYLINDIYWISVLPNTGNVRTGSRVIAYYNDGPAVEYSIVIYGDIDGDGWYDATDSVIVECIANGLLSKEQIGEAAYKAADCNHDGVVDAADVSILRQAGLVLSSVDQSKSHEELQSDSAYMEYLSLIDQSPEAEDTLTDEPVDEDFSKSFIERLFDFIMLVISFIGSVIAGL